MENKKIIRSFLCTLDNLVDFTKDPNGGYISTYSLVKLMGEYYVERSKKEILRIRNEEARV